MTWQQVARKDFEDAVRSKLVWGIVAVFVGFVGFALVVAIGTADDPASAPADAALEVTAALSQLFVPIIGLIVGYMSVVGERRSGSLRILLGYPHSRRDVVAGKLAGRAGVIAVALAAGSVVSILVVSVVVGSPSLWKFAGTLAATTLFGVAFTGLAVGISAGSTSRGKAMALSIGSVLVFLLVWKAAAAGVYATVTGSLPGLEVEGWYLLLKRLNPINAFRALATSAIDRYVSAFFQIGVEEIPANTSSEQLRASNRVAGDLPFYLSDWFTALVLTAWGVVPAAVGYLRFERSDL
jgi:ABC-2 type transport system permease protein